MASLTRRFVSAKRLFRDLSEFRIAGLLKITEKCFNIIALFLDVHRRRSGYPGNQQRTQHFPRCFCKLKKLTNITGTKTKERVLQGLQKQQRTHKKKKMFLVLQVTRRTLRT